jgi:hypothetical protein
MANQVAATITLRPYSGIAETGKNWQKGKSLWGKSLCWEEKRKS